MVTPGHKHCTSGKVQHPQRLAPKSYSTQCFLKGIIIKLALLYSCTERA